MSSSRDEARPVDPSPGREPKVPPPTTSRPTGRSRPNAKAGGSIEPPPRYSPVVLLLDVVHLLQGQGLPVSGVPEHLHQAIEASTDLLRWLGVDPDRRIQAPPRQHTPEEITATVLMRAAGIEPNAIKVWPGP